MRLTCLQILSVVLALGVVQTALLAWLVERSRQAARETVRHYAALHLAALQDLRAHLDAGRSDGLTAAAERLSEGCVAMEQAQTRLAAALATTYPPPERRHD